MINERVTQLLNLVELYIEKNKLSTEIDTDYYEPGQMEYLEQYYGSYDETLKQIIIRCDVKGLRYEGRSSRLKRLEKGDYVNIIRDPTNAYNTNNFNVNNSSGESLGVLSAELCNALAPLVDSNILQIVNARVSYLERLNERSRYANQGILFLEITMNLSN